MPNPKADVRWLTFEMGRSYTEHGRRRPRGCLFFDLSGRTNTRRVRRALAAVFAEGVGKDVVSRVWRKVKTDWDLERPLAREEPIVRLILDGRWSRAARPQGDLDLAPRRHRRARDGQKVLLAVKNMGGETSRGLAGVLDDLIARGLRRPEFLIVDGAPGLEKALAAVWDGCRHNGARCTSIAICSPMPRAAAREDLGRLHRHDLRRDGRGDRGAPEGVHPQMAAVARAVADSLEEAGESCSPSRGCRRAMEERANHKCHEGGANAIERLHEEFKRRIKTRRAASAETAAMLFWALLASGQIQIRKVDGWQSLATPCADQPVALAA